ncbi:hypothetical protein Mame01_02280 [Microbispora amethystogenes]|nr:hypothetical protein Mame01_02280 [Microbispora amethystogenes]
MKTARIADVTPVRDRNQVVVPLLRRRWQPDREKRRTISWASRSPRHTRARPPGITSATYSPRFTSAKATPAA